MPQVPSPQVTGAPGEAGTALQRQDQGRDFPTVREAAPEPAVASASANTPAPARAPGHRSPDGRTLPECPVVTTGVIGLWSQLLHSISRRILRQRPLDYPG